MKTPVGALALCLLAGSAGSALGKEPVVACRAEPLPATVDGPASALGGDTIAVSGLGPQIRIWGIEAPVYRPKRNDIEPRPGLQARTALEELLATDESHGVHCRPVAWDRDCRLVAVCDGPGGKDIGRHMLERGMAFRVALDEAPSDLARAYAATEAAARAHNVGLWPMWLKPLGDKP